MYLNCDWTLYDQYVSGLTLVHWVYTNVNFKYQKKKKS